MHILRRDVHAIVMTSVCVYSPLVAYGSFCLARGMMLLYPLVMLPDEAGCTIPVSCVLSLRLLYIVMVRYLSLFSLVFSLQEFERPFRSMSLLAYNASRYVSYVIER